MHETAKSEDDADYLKQMVFDRINSGGEKLTPQEKRNANFDGKLNKLCLKLSEENALCETWGIPLPNPPQSSIHSDRSVNKLFKTMQDVELVLRFFAYRQRTDLQRGSLESYLDFYLEKGNYFPQDTLSRLEILFKDTINLAFEIFGDSAFFLYRQSRNKWSWYERPTTVVYDPLMFALSQNIHNKDILVSKKTEISGGLEKLYQDNYEYLEGRNTNPAALQKRDQIFLEYIAGFVANV